MKRALLILGALALLVSSVGQVKGESFTFSITNTQPSIPGGVTTVPGTVTGEIFGLPSNGTAAATTVLIESFPAGLNSLESAPINATFWDQQNYNSFTVENDQVVSGGFQAFQTAGNPSLSYGFGLYINGGVGGPGTGNFNYVNLDGTNANAVWGDNGLAAANIRPIPEPASLTTLLLGIGIAGMAGFCGRRRKKAAA